MSSIIKEKKDSIFYITLNRPDSLNAFNTEMLMELQEALKEAESDDVRCVVITGAGKDHPSRRDLLTGIAALGAGALIPWTKSAAQRSGDSPGRHHPCGSSAPG